MIAPANAWAEAVFHVLSHVDAGASAASCFDPVYIAWMSERLGPARGRALGEDAATLGRALAAFEDLARAQALAWVFADAAAARAHANEELATTGGAGVDGRALLVARAGGAAVEVLRAAAELELDSIEGIGSPFDVSALEARIADVTRAAPELATCRIGLVRALPRRGRAFEGSIFVGVPGIAGADEEHVAWHAAHEAVVLATNERDFAERERRAIATLRSRARAVGLGERHVRWLATFGPIADVDDVGE